MTRLDNLLRHIRGVREGCELLGERMMVKDEHLAIQLIANGNKHDNSKFYGIEWEYLNDGAWPREGVDKTDEELFRAALKQHVKTNRHHPEYHNGIQNMESLYLHELIADWKARSSEQGTDLIEYIRGKGADKFKYSIKGRVYRELKSIAELLLDKKF